MPIVIPSGERRHRHQNRLGAAAGLQAEQGSPIVDQIEFHIAAAPVQLEPALSLAVGLILAALEDGHVGGQKVIAYAAREGERPFESALAEIVEEQAADPSSLIPVRQEEITVAPLLVSMVRAGAERLARVASGAVPVQDILVIGIVRCEIEA